MKIYTKTGDEGNTSLFGGRRISKDDLRIEAYGTVDELNANIGLLSAYFIEEKLTSEFLNIQNDLFVLGSHLAADPNKQNLAIPKLENSHIESLEHSIDFMDASMNPLRSFILPGGTMAISQAHICRTICRRAERRVVSLHQQESIYPLLIIYLNRLSDYFFTVARYIAHLEGVEDIPWIPKK
ncbi:MAG: cob(I)yrinic acid a,c-diamide adenosyltransferase [Bacteroidota bacterium]|nr:cob(I)yrinic acid a,c-diamide adenosyltransferase [Bacteroidota bacterium]